MHGNALWLSCLGTWAGEKTVLQCADLLHGTCMTGRDSCHIHHERLFCDSGYAGRPCDGSSAHNAAERAVPDPGAAA